MRAGEEKDKVKGESTTMKALTVHIYLLKECDRQHDSRTKALD